MNHRELITSILAIAVMVPTILLSALSIASAQEEELPTEVVMQGTQTSMQDPLPGHEGHQLVMALPPRGDGLVWVGDATWVSSKPVEVVVLHGYNSSAVSNQTSAQFGEPLKAPFGDGEVAITLVKPDSGTPVPSGSIPFAGNALAFHTLSGDPFAVTYTIAATAEELTGPSGGSEEGNDEE
ncbi:MAG: hypothetical protein WBX01_01870 [Nitrososphaeraceae archaeon]